MNSGYHEYDLGRFGTHHCMTSIFDEGVPPGISALISSVFPEQSREKLPSVNSCIRLQRDGIYSRPVRDLVAFIEDNYSVAGFEVEIRKNTKKCWVRLETTATELRESDVICLAPPASHENVKKWLSQAAIQTSETLIDFICIFHSAKEGGTGGTIFAEFTSPPTIISDSSYFVQFEGFRDQVLGALSVLSYSSGDVILLPSGEVMMCNGEEMRVAELCATFAEFVCLYQSFRENAWHFEERLDIAKHAEFGWYSPKGDVWWDDDNDDEYYFWRH
jgi:hypothetical protein